MWTWTAVPGRGAGPGAAAPQGLRDAPSPGTEEQLNEYFAGTRQEDSTCRWPPQRHRLPESDLGRDEQIPYGEARTYGQLAAALGRPYASRAVGGACHCNPIAIIQPCHRVVGRSGHLTGYAYGVEVKEYLLELEQD